MLTRIISSIILIPLVIYLIYTGGIAFTAFMFLINLIGLHEFYKLCAVKKIETFSYPAYLVSALYFFNVHFNFANDSAHKFEFSPILILGFVFIILWLQHGKKIAGSIITTAATTFGFLYISVFLSFAVYIRQLAHGEKLLFTIILMIWAADTFAYFGGRAFGKHRLSPEISPKKSTEGVFAGIFGTLTAACFSFVYLNVPQLNLAMYLTLAFILNSFSVLGDLIESQFKRDCDVKDSSGLIPGHGGILDRIDSLLLSFPFAYYFFAMILK